MACNLTKGRGLPCKTGVGGIKAVFFVDFGGLGIDNIRWRSNCYFWKSNTNEV